MSYDIGTVKGRKELHNKKDASTYINKNMHIIGFSGGANGPMIQISIGDEHIQLTKDEAKGLASLLNEWIGY